MSSTLFRAEALQAQQEALHGLPLRLGRLLKSARQRPVPLVLQSEAAECGLACLAMVAGHHGHRIDLASLRARHPVSQKGATLGDLMRIAQRLALAARPLRLELDGLADLALPCVIHWDFNHFVVLARVRGRRVVVHDPACGRRELTLAELSRHFTGVALELSPMPRFTPRRERRDLPIAALVGRLPGLRAHLLKLLALALLLQLMVMAAPFQLQWVVDRALAAHERGMIVAVGIGFVLLALVQAGVAGLRAWLLVVLGTTLNMQLMSRVFHHLLRLPMAWFDKRQIGDILSRFDSLRTIQRSLSTGFLEAVVDGVMAALTLVMMLLYSVKLALIGIGAAAVVGALRLALYRPMRDATEELLARSARQHGHFLESVRGVQCMKLFAQEDRRFARWQNLLVEQTHAAIRLDRLGVLYQALNGAVFGIENALTVWVGALLVLDASGAGAFTIGMLFAFIACKTQFVQRSAALIDKVLELRMLRLHAERVGDVALAEPEAQAPPDPVDVAWEAAAIELKSVSFRFAENEPAVLHDLSLRIEAGECVALTGPSGCGKTTLVKLMLGLLQPTAGQVEIGGVPLAHIDRRACRDAMASVMQDDQLFAGSIADNICFFDPQPDHERICLCARLAAVLDDIAAMPMQMNTLVGDMGTVLSGGQKQRILLARALYRRPRILFLDEATSHLDIVRERSVNDAVRGLKLTRVIVAHRPETIASADRLIVLGGPAARPAGASTPH
jgi:ATP-binding cassette subfamily B protein RaxB